MSEPCKKTPHEQKPSECKQVEQPSCKVKPASRPRLSLKELLPFFNIAAAVAYLKGLYFRRRMSKLDSLSLGEDPKNVQPIPDNITKLITAAEEKMQYFYEALLKKVKDIADNDLQQLKSYSQEELARTKVALSEYSARMQKISEEKLKRLAELKIELRAKLMTFEEVQKLGKFFEAKFAEVSKMTEELFEKIRKSEELPVAKDLRKTMETNFNKVKVATAALLVAIKDHSTKVGQLKETLSKRKFAMPAFPKIAKPPGFPKELRIPGFQRMDLFKRKVLQAEDGKPMPRKPLIPLLVKEKLQFFNLGKHFNSETVYGRANVAKATYAGILVYYLYRKVKGSAG